MPQHVQQTVQFEAERSRLNEWLVILLFGAILLTPFVTQVIGYTTDSTTENRVLAPFPKISSLREIKLLPKMSENYVNDRFGLRRQLVHFNSLARYRLGLSSSKDVVVGKDGVLHLPADVARDWPPGTLVRVEPERRDRVLLTKPTDDWSDGEVQR